jgi:hypothetical protein
MVPPLAQRGSNSIDVNIIRTEAVSSDLLDAAPDRRCDALRAVVTDNRVRPGDTIYNHRSLAFGGTVARHGLTLIVAAAVCLGGGVAGPTAAALAGPPPAASAATLTPLPPPGQPVVSELTPTSARLTWTRPAGPVFRYQMKQFVDGAWQGYASMPFNTFVVDLTPGGTRTFAVQAHALVGSGYTSSELSPPVTVTAPWD